MCADWKALFRWPFSGAKFILQCWFIHANSVFTDDHGLDTADGAFLIFTLNILLAQFGAADISSSGAAIGAVAAGPLTAVLVVAGAGSGHLRRPQVPHHLRNRRDDGGAGHRSPSTVWWCRPVLASMLVATLLRRVITVTAWSVALFLLHLPVSICRTFPGGACLATLTLVVTTAAQVVVI